MFLSSNLLTKLIHDSVLKMVGAAPYDIDRINGKTETGGLELVGSVDQVIATGGTTQKVANWTGTYQTKVIVASAAAGTLTTTAGLDFGINASGHVSRTGNGGGEIRLELVSDNDGVVATQILTRNANEVTKFDFSVAAEAISATSVLSLNISGATITGETFKVSDAALFAESDT